MTDEHHWTLTLHPDPVAIVRLEPGSELPTWARPAGPLTSVSWNSHETSVIALSANVPGGVDHAGPFLAYEVVGPLDFTLVGVLHDLLQPLTGEGISVVTMSTFDTDWILVPVVQAGSAARLWAEAGHTVHEPADSDYDSDYDSGSDSGAHPGSEGSPSTS